MSLPRNVGSTPAALRGLVISLGALLACSPGEKREFVGPPDTTPTDKKISALVVTPGIATVQRDEAIAFSAYGLNNSGDSVAAQVSWSASGGTIDNAGVFSASSSGRFWIKARSVAQADKADSASVLVLTPDNPIARLTINPKQYPMIVGQSRQFTATAYLEDGSTGDFPIYWTVSGGSITPDGTYTTPDAPGIYLIIAIVGGGFSDTARVSVTSLPLLTSLALSPSVDTVDEGDSHQYIAKAQWSDGADTLPALDFSATGGVVDSAGMFTAIATPGNYSVTAVERGGSTSASANIVVRENLASVAVAPSSLTIAAGASQSFAASGKTRKGVTIPVQVNWSATGGTVSSSGVYQAGSTAGNYRIIARSVTSGIADTVPIIVQPTTGTLTQLILNPSSVTLGTGAKQQFSVSASWSDGSSTMPAVQWSATGGTISSSGLYSAGSGAGTFQVIARHAGGTKADTSTVTITAKQLVGLTVTPGSASATSGNTVQFSVAGSYSDGSSGVPAVSWSTTGGTISGTGLFTAGTSRGTFRVIAFAAGIADTSLVTVSSPPAVIQRIVVTPATGSLVVGGSQQFFANALYTNGTTAPVSVNWSATGGPISSAGKYTAGSTPGNYHVIAVQQNGFLADTSFVTITPQAPTLSGIKLTPASVTLQPAGTQQFTAVGIWSDGSNSVVAVNYSATGGTISSSGSYQAGSTKGTYRVVATQQGGSFADTSSVTITTAQPQLVGIKVSPDSATATIGSNLTYSATGVWTNGGSGNPAVTWSASGGSINSSGVYTPGSSAGTYRVIANQQGGTLADTVTVFVSAAGPKVASLLVAPLNKVVQTGTKTQYVAEATLSNGSHSTSQPVTWTAAGGTITSTGLYSAGINPGTYKIMAKAVGGTAADTTNVTLSGPFVTKVVISPASVSLKSGTTQLFAVAAIWSDGVSRPVGVSFKATGGNVSVNGLYTAGSATGTFMVIATCACGVADTSMVGVTPNGSGGTPYLTGLQLTPNSASLAPGGSKQFSVSATWSNGGTTLPALTFSASGGSITQNGSFTAPSNVGNYRVMVTDSSGAVGDTAQVVVQSGGGSSAPWVVEDFSSYTSTSDLLQFPNNVFNQSEDHATQYITLDQSQTYGGGRASMKFSYPNRTGPSLCSNFTISRGIKLPQTTTEVWFEAYVMFSSNFDTQAAACPASVVNPDFKFLFGMVNTSSRFDLRVGNSPSGRINWGYPDNETAFQGIPIPTSGYFDGQWHRWRLHMKVGPNGQGIATAYFDNILIHAFTGVTINRSWINGIALGRTMNQGPDHVQTINWGLLKVWNNDPGWGW